MPEVNGRILALDLATIVGWAAAGLGEWRPIAPLQLPGAPPTWEPNGGIKNLAELKQYRDDHGSMFSGFRDWLDGLITSWGIVIVVKEAPVMHSYPDALRISLGLGSIAELVARDRDIPIFEKAPKAIKKFATGNGNANKPMMVAAAKARGWHVVDDNHADALWLLDFTLHFYAEQRGAA